MYETVSPDVLCLVNIFFILSLKLSKYQIKQNVRKQITKDENAIERSLRVARKQILFLKDINIDVAYSVFQGICYEYFNWRLSI